METLSSTKTQSWLSWFLRGVLILGFLVLIGRLIDLSIIRGDYFRQLAEGNRIRRVPITAPRGNILARGGEVLVGNKEVKRRVVFQPESGYKKLDYSEQGRDEEKLIEWVRDYKLAGDFAHVSGYLGEVGSEELGKVRAQCPEKGPRGLGQLVGRGGIEEEYDCTLSGIDGERLVEVDAQGISVRTLGEKLPLTGKDVKTTINFGLQKKVSELMKDKNGAVVVTDSRGEVLALYSSPSFDPNIFVDDQREFEVTSLLKNPNLPLFNRAIAGLFHPGSVFKPIVAVASLEEGKINEDYFYEDKGQITIDTPYGRFTYSNWYFTQYGGIEGKIDVTRAIARSTDTFFYKLGELVGIENLNLWAEKFGLNKETGIDLPGEVSGLVPNPDWKLKVKGEKWFLGNTYHISIGQGDIALTPIGVNSAIETISANGLFCGPHILARGESENDKCRNLGISESTIKLVKEGMKQACSPGGTGFTFFDFKEKYGLDVACKTGTAETEIGEPHAWFSSFAPVDFPEIVATILVEHGGEGSRVAGPIAREIFDYWFLENKQ